MASSPNTIVSYPAATSPLDGSEAYAGWQNGAQKQITGLQLATFILKGVGTPSDVSAVAAGISALLASSSAAQAAAAAAIRNVLATSVAAGGTLPFEVTQIAGGIGTGSGGAPGTYAGGVAGGPAGFQWQYTIDATGKLASYQIVNPGIASANSAPTLSLPFGGLTGATVPTATVGAIPVGRMFYAPSSDGTQILAWGSNAGVLASAPFGGSQLALYTKDFIDAATSLPTVAETGASADLASDSPSLFIDPDMLGVVGLWSRALTPSIIGGRKALTNVGGDANCLSDITALATGDPISLGFAIEALTIAGATMSFFVAQVDANGNQIAGTTSTLQSISASSAPTALPKPYRFSLGTKNASAVALKFFMLMGNTTNSVTISQIGLYPSGSAAYRAPTSGRVVEYEPHLASIDAAAEKWANPNLSPDPLMTGSAANGWVSGAATVVRLATGRRVYRFTGAMNKLRLPVSALGGVGAVFSVAMALKLVSASGANSVYVNQIKADTTNSAQPGALTYIVNNSAETWSRTRRKYAAAITIVSDAAYIEIGFNASNNAANVIEASLLSIHRGTSPSYRDPLPSPAVLAAYLGNSLGGTTATPDYFVDGRPGSNIAADANSGTSSDTPFKTLAAAIAAVGATANKIIGIRRGSIFRGQSITSPAVGLKVIAYGPDTDPSPQVLGSASYKLSQFVAVGDGTYTLALTYKPTTLALVSPTGVVTKLYNPDANTVPPVSGNWSQASNVLTIFPPAALGDLTGYTVEIPLNTGSGYGFAAGAANQTVDGVVFAHWSNHGADSSYASTVWLRTWCNYNGYDGYDMAKGCTNFVVRFGGAIGNGRRFGSDSGPGDGVSAHATATGIVEFCTLKQNCQTGVGNEPDTNVTVRYCYLEDNFADLQVYNNPDAASTGFAAGHQWYYNLIVHKTNNNICLNVSGNAFPAPVTIQNNTIWYLPTLAGAINVVGSFSGMTVDLANNIIVAPTAAQNNLACYGAAVVTSRNNILRRGTNAGQWQSGYDPVTKGGSETGLLTTDPQLNDPANGDYTLKSTSPAVGAGVALGYSRDYAGNKLPTTPDRGAFALS